MLTVEPILNEVTNYKTVRINRNYIHHKSITIVNNTQLISTSVNSIISFMNNKGGFRRITFEVKKLEISLIKFDSFFKRADLRMRMELYADLEYAQELLENTLQNKIESKKHTQIESKINKFYLVTSISLIKEANEKFFQLTYPDYRSLDDSEYVLELNEAYSTIPPEIE